MKKVLLTLLGIILVVGVLAGAGFTGYRIGYMRGARTTQGVRVPNNFTAPLPNRSDKLNQGNMPKFRPGMNDRNFGPGFAPNRFPMMRKGRGLGFFPPFQFIWRIVVFGLIIWFFYWLFAKSGLQVSFNRKSAEAPAVEASAPPKKENEE